MTIFPLRAIILVFLVALLLLFSSQSMKRKEQTMEISNEDLRVPEMFPVTNESLCSDRAALRGPRQRVVSFNYFGQYNHRRRYFAGIEANAQFLPTYYPDWTMRVYHSVGREDPIWQILYALEEFYPHLDLCDITNLPIPGNLYAGQKNAWRFLPIVDNLVEVFLSRDLDSRISNREVAAVDEWLNSNLSFHVMRDSTYHNVIMLDRLELLWRFLPMSDPLVDVFVSRDLDTRLSDREKAAVNEWLDSNLTFHVMRDHLNQHSFIPEGMWGSIRNLSPKLIKKISKEMQSNSHKKVPQREREGMSKYILDRILWPQIEGKVMQHDSYFCRDPVVIGHGHVTPWPTERTHENGFDEYVGRRLHSDIETYLKECPVECRPSFSSQWEKC